MTQLEILEATLSEDDRARLKAIYAPTVVCTPPEDARRSLAIMPDGEIRAYGISGKTSTFAEDSGQRVYLSSRSCGLDWRLVKCESNSVLGASVKLPWRERWVTMPTPPGAPTYACYSDIGPDDVAPMQVKVDDGRIIDMFQPICYEPERRITVCGHLDNHPIFMYSDDDGESWTKVHLKPSPKHEAVFPHKGVRWQNTSTETTYTRLADGRLMLLARTSLDYLYVYYSSDLGETWTDGELTNIHCTLTSPFMLKLHDGRTILFWNNTRPLAEISTASYYPPLGRDTINGVWEDVFTNRDANHAAISDDCEHWVGLRELGLNEVRNSSDFRVKGGILSSADKSVHQFQAIELPYGKVLVIYGQHEISRKAVIFDVDWLYEKKRVEDWQTGLKNVTTHMYVKSISESHIWRGYAGHCAWNRTDGALLVPDPALTYGEALQICRTNDERLAHQKQGVVWNFPASESGEVKLQLRVEGSGVAIRLCDHWMNACDEHVGLYASYDFALDSYIVAPGVWHEISICFEADVATVTCDGNFLFKVARKKPSPFGISYLHIQTLAESTDFKGTLIRRMEFSGK